MTQQASGALDPLSMPVSRRLEYRPIVGEDVPEVVALHCDPRVRAQLVDGVPDNLAKGFAFLYWNEPMAAKGFGTFAVRRRGDPALIGLFSLTPFEGDEAVLELGGKLAPSAWSGGLSIEAGAAMISHAFGPLDRDRIVSAIDPAQRSAAAALRRLEFVEAGESILFDRPIRRFNLSRADWRARGELAVARAPFPRGGGRAQVGLTAYPRRTRS